MILDAYQRNYRRYVRDPLAEVKREERYSYDDNVAEVISYYNRKTNMAAIKAAMKARFGTAIVRESDKRDLSDTIVSAWKGVEYYIRSEVSDAIDLGHVEKVDTGIGIRIVQTLANLLNQPDQYWLYTDPEDEDNQQIEDVQALIAKVRERGGYNTVSIEMDLCSCMVESAILHMYYSGRELQYDLVIPSNIWLKYGRNLEIEYDDGTTDTAWVNTTKIEDASAVIIQTGADGGDFDGSPDENQYLAYVGACRGQEEGRFVVYRAREPWPIPDIGDTDAIIKEHDVNGTICNPLTYMRHHGTDGNGANKELVTTEYPIMLWRGGHQMISDDRIPITTSLYENSVELEIGWSRVLRAALNGARGRDLITLAEGHTKVPASLEAPVMVEGDTLEQIGWPASNAKDATDVMQIITAQTAGGHHVPGYVVLDQIGGVSPSSGVALAIQTQPLIGFRNYRRRLNEQAMARQFDIERAMLVMEYPEAAAVLTPDVVQNWDPGTWRPPTTDAEESQAINASLDNGTMDIVAAVRQKHRLATDEEAEALIAMWRERDPQYEFGKDQEPEGEPDQPQPEKDEEDDEE